MTQSEMESEILALRARADALEQQLRPAPQKIESPKFYWAYHVLAGFTLGIFGACTSLIFNVVGSLIVGQHPLQLIRVYLTFPLGEEALRGGDHGLILAIGCCLYLVTGMLLGIPFHLVLRALPSNVSFAMKLLVASALACAIWLINFYAILSWLQPLLYGGRWIVDLIPWWVGLLTHLIFGWTMVLVQPLGHFEDYPHPASSEAA